MRYKHINNNIVKPNVGDQITSCVNDTNPMSFVAKTYKAGYP